MSLVAELFGRASNKVGVDWSEVVAGQLCPFLGRRCYKVRKSDPGISIGSCAVRYGRELEPILICPTRLIERRQIFVDCLHLLTLHEPGNELHIVSEVAVPGGSVDYFVISAKDGRVRDFVGVELQTLDTTGTVWPERQRLLKQLGIPRLDDAADSSKTFGMNWKMTAKTILVQMHHKVETFEHVNKKLVLVVQDKLLDYMAREFNFGHLANPATLGDSMHFHAYKLAEQADHSFSLGAIRSPEHRRVGHSIMLGSASGGAGRAGSNHSGPSGEDFVRNRVRAGLIVGVLQETSSPLVFAPGFTARPAVGCVF